MATLQDLFAQQVKARGNALALKFEDGRGYSYNQLNEKAQTLRNVLIKLGVVEDALVAIKIERCPGLIVGLLGIHQANAGYIPIDPIYPVDRQTFMLDDSKASVLIVSTTLAQGNVNGASIPTVIIDEDGSVISVTPVPFVSMEVAPTERLGNRSLAYVLYTSGSTGKPKGVMIEHRSVVNLLGWFAQELKIGTADIILGLTTFCFDISILEMFLPLTCGAVLCLVSANTQRDPELLLKILDQEHVTMMQATPATLEMLTHVGWQGDPNIDVLCGGEAFRLNLSPIVPQCRSFRNVYGPTETTIWSSSYTMRGIPKVIPPIGKPISETTFHVLTENMTEVPEGQVGELYIGGIGLARGYLGRPDLTEKVFVRNPFGPGRIYKTGDLAKKEGENYICLGRLDSQVKIRGYRVELGEIEKVLQVASGVQTAVVLAREDIVGVIGLTLVAYVKLQQGVIHDQQTVSSQLAVFLPSYMVPPFFVFVDQFPNTPNGKIDRKALQPPVLEASSSSSLPPASRTFPETSDLPRADGDGANGASSTDYDANHLMDHIILHIKQHTGAVVQPDSSLASIGIDSISSVLFVRKLSTSLGATIPLATLYQAESVRALATAIQPLLKGNSKFASSKVHINAANPDEHPYIDKVAEGIRNSIPILQGTRGVLILWVLLDHFELISPQTNPKNMQNNTEYLILLSGFTAMLQLSPSWSWTSFLSSRAWSIFPIYYLSLFLHIPVYYLFTQNRHSLEMYHHPPYDALSYFTDAIFFLPCLQTWFPHTIRLPIATVSFASVQWSMYILFALIIVAWQNFPGLFCLLSFSGGRRTQSRTVLLSVVAAIVLLLPSAVYSMPHHGPSHPRSAALWIPMFAIGMGCAKLFEMFLRNSNSRETVTETTTPTSPTSATSVTLQYLPDVIVAVQVIGIVWPPNSMTLNIYLNCVLYKLLGAIFLLLTLLQSPSNASLSRRHFLESPVAQQIGQLFYPLYLFHAVLMSWYFCNATKEYFPGILPPRDLVDDTVDLLTRLDWIQHQTSLLKILGIVLSIAVSWLAQQYAQDLAVPRLAVFANKLLSPRDHHDQQQEDTDNPKARPVRRMRVRASLNDHDDTGSFRKPLIDKTELNSLV
eukprot:c8404_g1_i1.p1 GENE.c8404_g1_i1~~c8404_g1_i1.p1  ORF type:complete len:1113 (+),score=217.40 c8404_g1_i1:140-3478(+)